MVEHDHTDIETLATLYECVRALLDERDRLAAEVPIQTDAADAAAEAVGAMAEKCSALIADLERERAVRSIVDRALGDAVAERDRLRLVVERAHDHVGLDEPVLRTLGVDGLIELVGVLRRDYAEATAESAP